MSQSYAAAGESEEAEEEEKVQEKKVEKEKEKEMENYKEVGEEGTDKGKEEEMGKIHKEEEEASAPRSKLSPGSKSDKDTRNLSLPCCIPLSHPDLFFPLPTPPRNHFPFACLEGDKRNFPSLPLSPAIDTWVPSLGLAADQTERQTGRRVDEESTGQQRGKDIPAWDPSSSGALERGREGREREGGRIRKGIRKEGRREKVNKGRRKEKREGGRRKKGRKKKGRKNEIKEESFLSLIATPASHGERREILRMVIGQPLAIGMHFLPPF
ncbi:Histone-lysine N-methyltransferase MLL4, partial [Ophiophagus hannah]